MLLIYYQEKKKIPVLSSVIFSFIILFLSLSHINIINKTKKSLLDGISTYLVSSLIHTFLHNSRRLDINRLTTHKIIPENQTSSRLLILVCWDYQCYLHNLCKFIVFLEYSYKKNQKKWLFEIQDHNLIFQCLLECYNAIQ